MVIPTLNSARTLDMTLMSLRLQIGCDALIKVVDSGSTDGTLDICKRWNVPTSYEPPGNMYQAINQGLRSCDTEWLMYLNSDDYLYPRSLARLLAAGESQKADVAYGVCDYVDSEGRFLHSFTPAPPTHLLGLFRCNFFGFSQQTAIFRERVFTALDGFDERFDLSADADFYVRALVKGFSFTRLLGSSIAVFRLSQNQLSNTRAAELVDQLQSSVARTLSPATLGDRLNLALLRVRNSPQYSIRILRSWCLGRARLIPRTMDGDITWARSNRRSS